MKNPYWLNEKQIIEDSSHEIEEFKMLCDFCGKEITGNIRIYKNFYLCNFCKVGAELNDKENN